MTLKGLFTRNRLLMFLSVPMAFLSPVLATLFSLHISPSAPGAVTFVLLVMAIGCVFGLLAAALADAKGLWKILFVMLVTLVVAITVDLSILGEKYLAETADQSWAQIGIILIFLIFIFGFVWLIAKNIPVILFVTSLTLLATTLAQSSAQAADPKPPTVYIIMDEMIGLNGIDTSIEGGQQTYDLARSVFEKHGFKIYSRAFSRHFFTKVSIPAILNFDEKDSGVEISPYTDNKEHLTVKQNALFDLFAAQGSSISVYQSGHVNFCIRNVNDCNSFPSFNAESKYTEHIDPEVVRKANIGVIRSIYLQSYFMAPLLPLFSDVADEPDLDDHPAYFDLHGFGNWFDEFTDSLREAKPGSLHFAHFLMPHGPALLNENCLINNNWESPYYLKEQSELSEEAFQKRRNWFYQLYFKQMQCGVKKLDRLLTRLEADPSYKGATIVIHGDHGSRISSGKYIENAGPRDFIDNYSAFYAIRKPGLTAGIDDQTVSVQRLTKLHFSGKADSELGDAELSVMVHSKTQPNGVKAPIPVIP